MSNHLTEAQERERFESWMLTQGYGTKPRICSTGSPCEGEYADQYWHRSWSAWLAAKADATTSAESEVGATERIALVETALTEMLEFQSAPEGPHIFDWGRWRRIRDNTPPFDRAALAASPVAQPDAGALPENFVSKWTRVIKDMPSTYEHPAASAQATQAVESVESVANYLPVHVAIIEEIERVGQSCLDGGTCHHACRDTCSRRKDCVPLSLASSYLNDDWTLRGFALAATPLPSSLPAAQTTEPLTDEQIEKGRRDTFSTDNPFCPCDSKTMRKAVRWAERAHNIGAAPAADKGETL